MTSEERIGKPSRSYRGVVLGAFLAFLCLIALAYRAVEVAQEGQEDARTEAELAKAEAVEAATKVDELQRNQDCAIKVLVRGLSGLIDNAIKQADVLLISAEAGERANVIQSLRETRAQLVSIAAEAAKAHEECT